MCRLLLLFLLILSVGLSACSFSTDFVVVNEANYPIQVIYKIKPFPSGSQNLEVEPKVASAADLESRDSSKWTKLHPNQYRVDQLSRTVTVTLHAREALLITSMSNYTADKVKDFPIEAVSIKGAAGEMTFTGEKARQAFQYVSTVLYKLTYK